MSTSEAFRTLHDSVLKIDEFSPAMRVRVTETGLETELNGVKRIYRFQDTPVPKLETCGGFSNCLDKASENGSGQDRLQDCGWISNPNHCMGAVKVFTKATGIGVSDRCCNWYWNSLKRADGERFVVAFKVLVAGIPAESQQEVEQFNLIVEQYRSGSSRPEFPEEARRARVQAESAVRDKRYSDAVDRYEAALKIAPWWPEGRFNRALMLGEVERYTEAIREMKKYLALVPDAPNARAVQDKIYEWEARTNSVR